eukprot:1387301-Pyramimonas_sp.AAC.1
MGRWWGRPDATSDSCPAFLGSVVESVRRDLWQAASLSSAEPAWPRMRHRCLHVASPPSNFAPT